MGAQIIPKSSKTKLKHRYGKLYLKNGRPVDRVVPERRPGDPQVIRRNAEQRRNNLPVREVNRTIIFKTPTSSAQSQQPVSHLTRTGVPEGTVRI